MISFSRRVALAGALGLALLVPSSSAFAERVQIRVKRLTVRAGPGSQHKRLGAVPKGRILEVTERKGGWVAIRFKGRKGWLSGRFVRTVKGSAAAPHQSGAASTATHTVVANRLNVRSTGSVKGKLRFKLRRGARVSIKETRDAWCHIEHRGRAGWVMARYLVAGKAPPPRRKRRRPRRKRPKSTP